jgi:hypothetical protein
MLKYLFAAIVLTASSLCAAAESSTLIGTLHLPNDGIMSFIIRQSDCNIDPQITDNFGNPICKSKIIKAASIVAFDKYKINKIVYFIPHEDLQKLHDMVDATITALASPAPKITSMTLTDMGHVLTYDAVLRKGGSMSLSIIQDKNERFASLHIADVHDINKVDLPFPLQGLKKLLSLIDETKTELGPDLTLPQEQPKLDKEASNMSAPTSSSKGKAVLGVNVIDLPPSIALGLRRENMKAAFIVAISPGSISDKAGFKVGDVIYEFDGKPIEKFTDLQKAVSEIEVGRKVLVKLLRGEKELSIDAQF